MLANIAIVCTMPLVIGVLFIVGPAVERWMDAPPPVTQRDRYPDARDAEEAPTRRRTV
jgi:hypothetical protein